MRTRTLLGNLVVALALATPAFAVDTTQVYFSGYIVLAFVALCALVVVAQIAPAVMLLVGFVKMVGENIRSSRLLAARGKR